MIEVVAGLYRRQIENMRETLADTANRCRVVDALRALIDEILLVPVADGDKTVLSVNLLANAISGDNIRRWRLTCRAEDWRDAVALCPLGTSSDSSVRDRSCQRRQISKAAATDRITPMCPGSSELSFAENRQRPLVYPKGLCWLRGHATVVSSRAFSKRWHDGKIVVK